MPAVELGRLQQEAATLTEVFSDSDAYVQRLEKMLEVYASPVHRTGSVRGLRPVLFTYETAPIVLKQLLLEMGFQGREDPGQALEIADSLWKRRTIETRQLAIRLLGSIPATKPSEVTQRLESWLGENREDLLAPEFWGEGIMYLCKEFPQELIRFAGNLTRSLDIRKQIFGFGSLRKIITINPQGNIPSVFFILDNFNEDPNRKLRPYIADLFSTLAEHSPKETAFFLQERIGRSFGEGMLWIVRQVAKKLPTDQQAQLLRKSP